MYSSLSSRRNSSFSITRDNNISNKMATLTKSFKSRHIKYQSQTNQISSLIYSDYNFKKTTSDYDSMTSAIALNNKYPKLKRRQITSFKPKTKEMAAKTPSFFLISKNHTKKGTVNIIQQHLKAQIEQQKYGQLSLRDCSSNKILLKNIQIIKENIVNKIEDMKPKHVFHKMKMELLAKRNKFSLLFYNANKQRVDNEQLLKIFTTRIISSRRNLKF